MERDGNPAVTPEHSSDIREEMPAVQDLDGDQRATALERELAEERRLRHEAEERADKDDLLESMYRKKATIELIQDRIERGEVFAVYFLDINNFKSYNDSKEGGHVAGDELLRTIEELLNERFKRKTDNVKIGRYGGDEILLVVMDIVTGGNRSDNIYEQVENVRNRLMSIVPELHERDPLAKKLNIGFAIGSALFNPGQPVDAKELIGLADQDMYADKKWQKWQRKSKLARFTLSLLGKKPAQPHRIA